MIKLIVFLVFVSQVWDFTIGERHGGKFYDRFHQKIIGGSPAAQGKYPFIVSINQRTPELHLCGATILNERFLLTAGHCAFGFDPKDLIVYAGSILLSSGGSYHEIDSFIIHPDFDQYNLYDDISLYKLKDPLVFNDDVQPLALPPSDIVVLPGESATAIGWGYTSYNPDEAPDQLQFLAQTIMDTPYCHELMGSEIRDSQICFGGNKGFGLCYGDSGSPLLYTKNDTTFPIGLTSWGYPCATGFPDVLTRISFYVPWILQNIQS